MERQVIISLFPGIDLLGRAFEEQGFCVLRGPDLLWGGDIKKFSMPVEIATGIIAGSPCQDFSKARRNIQPTGKGIELIKEFARCVTEAQPRWWLLENVPAAPHLRIKGYATKRLDVCDSWFGGVTLRRRHVQFGHKSGEPWPIIPRDKLARHDVLEPTAKASEGRRSKKERRTWPDFCELQGLNRDFDLPGFTVAGKYRAVGNDVSMHTGRAIAKAVAEMHRYHPASKACACGCGRILPFLCYPTRKYANDTCRKRAERDRKGMKGVIVCY